MKRWHIIHEINFLKKQGGHAKTKKNAKTKHHTKHIFFFVFFKKIGCVSCTRQRMAVIQQKQGRPYFSKTQT